MDGVEIITKTGTSLSTYLKMITVAQIIFAIGAIVCVVLFVWSCIHNQKASKSEKFSLFIPILIFTIALCSLIGSTVLRSDLEKDHSIFPQKYIVRVDNSVSANEFLSKYKIHEQLGNNYIVSERRDSE